MKALVFGGNGYIGGRVVSQLRERGCDVVTADVTSTSPEEDLVVDVRFSEDVHLAVLKVRPDVIVQMAAVLAGGTAADPTNALRINVEGANSVFRAAAELGVAKVVYASSIAVYGDQSDFGDFELHEDAHGRPATLYGWMKQMDEALAATYARGSGSRYAAVRISSVFGGGREGGKFNPVGLVLAGMRHGREVVLPYAQDHVASLIHVDDVATVFTTLALADEPRHAAYNTGGTTIEMGGLAELARSHGGEIRCADTEPVHMPHVGRVSGRRFQEEFGEILPSFEERFGEEIANRAGVGARG